MNTSPVDMLTLTAQDVRFSEDDFTVDLSDGRTITIPLAWFPRLFLSLIHISTTIWLL